MKELLGKVSDARKLLRLKKIYKRNRKLYNEKYGDRKQFSLHKEYDYPCLYDRLGNAGVIDQCFWMDLWAARLVFENDPDEHWDIGGSLKGFIGHLASYRDNIHLLDYRPIPMDIPGVEFFQTDATNLEGVKNESIESLSALFAIEHFGLGRYGDPIDPDAWKKSISAIMRVIKKGGHAYIAVPIGKEHLEFDAHRIFYASTIVDAFKPMELIEYSCVRHEGIEKGVPLDKYDDEYNYGQRIGLFHFMKNR